MNTCFCHVRMLVFYDQDFTRTLFKLYLEWMTFLDQTYFNTYRPYLRVKCFCTTATLRFISSIQHICNSPFCPIEGNNSPSAYISATWLGVQKPASKLWAQEPSNCVDEEHRTFCQREKKSQTSKLWPLRSVHSDNWRSLRSISAGACFRLKYDGSLLSIWLLWSG